MSKPDRMIVAIAVSSLAIFSLIACGDPDNAMSDETADDVDQIQSPVVSSCNASPPP